MGRLSTTECTYLPTSAVPFPASPDPWVVVVMLVVRVVWVPEWMIVLLAVLLARVVWALA